jgi:hypothetical protein
VVPGDEPSLLGLGSFVADATGSVQTALALPPSPASGHLQVLASGANPFGGLRLVTGDLWLLGPCRALAGFSDVPASHAFCEPIDWLADAGITGGLGDGSFGTTLPLSRQGMAAFLYRLVGSPEFTPPLTPSFDDVPVSHPFFTEIEWLAASGITGGLGDGGFGPTLPLSRQGMAAFLFRLAGSGLQSAVS